MEETKKFNNQIHRAGRITVFIVLVCFISLPIILSTIYGTSLNIGEVLQNALPIMLMFTVVGLSENLAYTPLIGPGALYIACVTGDLSNMKVPASKNAMELLNATAGTEKGNLISILAVSTCTVVTTGLAFLGMLFLAPIIEPIYNNVYINPAFANLLPAIFGALIVPTLFSNLKINLPIFILPIIIMLAFGSEFFSSNQGYILLFCAVIGAGFSYFAGKSGQVDLDAIAEAEKNMSAD
ncbi:hypothetical protein [Enterococcus sp. HY326]|uniref:hypothetical protein n=1 Tax=Enterococcus sp. HY326 TaxID=2971265 RepID=UPI00223EF92A|nr:hypothetical protein [Enterococcus sp. HY326]